MKRRIAIFVVAALFGTVALAKTYPAYVVCAIEDSQNGNVRFVNEAKERIQKKFGELKANPKIITFNEADKFWPLAVNEYGSTTPMLDTPCILIGPKGQNINVISHELMHSEVITRVGYLTRLIKIPFWFDEGLAMQVDNREQYNLPEHQETTFVREFNTAKEFYSPIDNQLTLNYAASKSEVKKILSHTSSNSIFKKLETLRHGIKFDDIIVSEK